MTSWSELPLTEEHAAYLRDRAAITVEVAAATGIRSATTLDELPTHAQSWGNQALPAIVFPYRRLDGTVVEQVKPDEPIYYKDEAKPRKYLLAEGSGSTLNAVRPVPDAKTLLIVEGTKQTFAAASHAADDVAVYGIAGCRNWSQDGVPVRDLRVVKGRDVVIALDADVEHNLAVWEAGQRLAKALAPEQPTSVKFMLLPGSKTTGLDDLLADREDDEHRRDYLAGLIASAGKLPARKPAAKKEVRQPGTGDAYFEPDQGLLVHNLSVAVRDKMPAALTAERKIALYRDGYYDVDGISFSGGVGALLGNRFRPNHRAAVEEYTAGVLHMAGMHLPTYVSQPLLNVVNGMLHLPTQTLKPHDPSYLSGQQIPVTWNPDATCPTYDHWVRLCGVQDQLDDLEEAVSMMLDPSRTPHRAVFLFGPSRSGKSTFLRLMQAVVGERNYSAVTLQKLSEDRFAAANVFGKMLNCAADLSSAHVEDLSIFKMMTGEDPIQADRKFGNQFAFVNKALFAFSANNPPTVGEASRAYTARIKPFKFPVSFENREDPSMEEEMLANELPGILVRWVRAWQRRQERGAYLPGNAAVSQEFEIRSDRVRQFVVERCTVHTHTVDGHPITHGTTVDENRAVTKAEFAGAFNEWADHNQTSKMGRNKIIDRLMNLPGVVEVRRGKAKTRAINVTVREDGEDCWEGGDAPDESGGSSEAPVATLASKTATETATAELGKREPVAEVAVSSPLCLAGAEKTHSRAQEVVTESDPKNGVGDSEKPKVPHSALETATSATGVIRRPDLDRVEKAMEASGAVQPSLLDGHAPESKPAPAAPTHRVQRPGDAAELGPNTLTAAGSPFSSLVIDEDAQPTCPRCRGRKQLVPPTNFWLACPSCYPATFGA